MSQYEVSHIKEFQPKAYVQKRITQASFSLFSSEIDTDYNVNSSRATTTTTNFMISEVKSLTSNAAKVSKICLAIRNMELGFINMFVKSVKMSWDRGGITHPKTPIHGKLLPPPCHSHSKFYYLINMGGGGNNINVALRI